MAAEDDGATEIGVSRDHAPRFWNRRDEYALRGKRGLLRLPPAPIPGPVVTALGPEQHAGNEPNYRADAGGIDHGLKRTFLNVTFGALQHLVRALLHGSVGRGEAVARSLHRILDGPARIADHTRIFRTVRL